MRETSFDVVLSIASWVLWTLLFSALVGVCVARGEYLVAAVAAAVVLVSPLKWPQ